MKKIFIGCCAALMALGTTSCGDDFLSVEPSSKVELDSYYNSKSRVFEAVIAAYDPLQWFDYSDGWAPLDFVFDAMSDDVLVGGGHAQDQEEIHLISKFTSNSNKVISGAWGTCYSGINRCNMAIGAITNLASLSDADRNLYLSEIKVLRAYYYTLLWKLWGNVPYYEENLSFPYIKEQSKADEVYANIESTLREVIDAKALPMKQTEEWYGRITQATAEMIYADVVMYQQDEAKYAQALKYMEDIISSAKYDLVENYADLWGFKNEWNVETIFDINYVAKNGVRDWGNAKGCGGTVYPEMIGINGLSGSPDYTGGWGFEPVLKSTYDMFDAKDTRRDASILNFADYYAKTGAKYNGADRTKPYVEGDVSAVRYQDTGYFLQKYLPLIGDTEGASASAGLNHDGNLHMYRYAETLLNAAELAVRTNSGNAKIYLDEICIRAGVDLVDATLDNILKQRHLEFVGEGKRYWDLVRTGQAATVLKPNEWGRVQWTENKKYLPIPQTEIDNAQGTLTQNPY